MQSRKQKIIDQFNENRASQSVRQRKESSNELDKNELERKIYREMARELEFFDWDAAHVFLEKYLKKCSFIGYLVYLNHRAKQPCVSQKKFNVLKREWQKHNASQLSKI